MVVLSRTFVYCMYLEINRTNTSILILLLLDHIVGIKIWSSHQIKTENTLFTG